MTLGLLSIVLMGVQVGLLLQATSRVEEIMKRMLPMLPRNFDHFDVLYTSHGQDTNSLSGRGALI